MTSSPPEWRNAYNQLLEYAIATHLSNLKVEVKCASGSVIPANVDFKPTASGTTIEITLPACPV